MFELFITDQIFLTYVAYLLFAPIASGYGQVITQTLMHLEKSILMKAYSRRSLQLLFLALYHSFWQEGRERKLGIWKLPPFNAGSYCSLE